MVDQETPAVPRPSEAVRRPARRRPHYWVPAIVVAVGIHTAAFMFLGVSPRRSEHERDRRREARWVGERADDAIELRDPKAIVLPSRWSAGAVKTEDAETGAPGEIFPLERSLELVPSNEAPPGLVSAPEGIGTAAVAIERFSRPYFSAFGQHDLPVHRLPLRVARVEVRAMATGEKVFEMDVAPAAVARGGVDPAQWPLWAPFEMLLAVEPIGTLGLPLVATPGSGVDAVDDFFRSTLRTLLRPDLLLPAGYYRVLIGP